MKKAASAAQGWVITQNLWAVYMVPVLAIAVYEHAFPLDSDGYCDPDGGRPTLSGLGATVAANPDSVEERGRSAANRHVAWTGS
jgi:hypothetical protein